MMKAAVVAGLGVIGLIGGLFAYNHKKKVPVIPRDKMLATAKNLRNQMYMVLVDLSSVVRENASKVPPEQMRELMLSSDSTFLESIQENLKKVFKEFSEQDFQQNVTKYYKDDAEIQYHIKRYQQETQKAFLGVTPEIKQEIITFLDQQRLIEITKELLDAKYERIQQKVKQKITFKQWVLILRAQKEQERLLREEKLKNLGLVGPQKQLTNIYQFSVAKYIKMDQTFKQNYQKLIEDHRIKCNQYVDQYCCSFPRSTSKSYCSNSSEK